MVAVARRSNKIVAGWRLWADVILVDGANGFVVNTDLATAVIFGMKGVALGTDLSAKRPSSSHVTPLNEHLDLGRFTYVLGYIMAALMTASLLDPLPAAADEKAAKSERERAVKSWSQHPEFAGRAMSRHLRGKMNSWEATITGNSTTHWLTTASPAVAAAVWPGDTLHWMTSEGRRQYGYLWELAETSTHRHIEHIEKPFCPSNIIPGQPLPDVPIF